MPKTSKAFVLLPRLRVQRDGDVALGPGKVDLLEQIRETGSIAKAARQMEMSYMRAWTLVKTMEDCFREPLIQVERGGFDRGGARLTNTGEQVVALYRQMEKESLRATSTSWRALQKLLRR